MAFSTSSNRILVSAAVLAFAVLGFFTLRTLNSKSKATSSDGTPRTSDGKPDLTGYWGHLKVDAPPQLEGITDSEIQGEVGGYAEYIVAFEKDAQIGQRLQTNRPIYKHEYWQQIREKDWDYSRKRDPESHCLPGMPRMGIPEKIVQLPKEIIFFYESNPVQFRVVPTDGRTHHPSRANVPSWQGDSIGHWEGDDLIIQTIGLNDQGWLGPTGYIRTDQIQVTEKMHRDGNTLTLERIVDDPMLYQPWKMPVLKAKVSTTSEPTIWEEACDERDQVFIGNPREGR